MMGGCRAVVHETAGFIIVLDNVINLRIIVVNQILGGSTILLAQFVNQDDNVRAVVCQGYVVFGYQIPDFLVHGDLFEHILLQIIGQSLDNLPTETFIIRFNTSSFCFKISFCCRRPSPNFSPFSRSPQVPAK